jgi:Domain of unknown function (DUF4249)
MILSSMKKIALLAVAVVLFTVSCLREINLEAENERPATITIFGTFTNSAEPQRVFITRPNPFNNRPAEPILDAQVWVVSSDGSRAQYLPHTAQTVLEPAFCYQIPANTYIGQPGQTYHIEVTLTDGSVYRSEPATMPQSVGGGTLLAEGVFDDTTVVSEQKYIQISQENTLPNDSTHHLRFDIFRVYHLQQFYGDPIPPKTQTFCYVHEFTSNQTITLARYNNNGGQRYRQLLGRFLFDQKFEVLTYFTALQYTITPDAYRYWQQIDLVANPEGTIFDAPPASVKGNLYKVDNANELPLGYFEVAAIDTARLRLNTTTDIGTEFAPATYCAYSPPTYAAPGPECWCCLVLPFSQYQRPWYWVP